ncbi:Dihydropteroate synthase [Aquisphaera giovannonii]|uniref:Dihydropteroate synthase n=1 Tax=Aquisphaera giovannonii TaxID=406548 RepID=A0A5B9W1F9_9BACT|nr:dihydropteroate synthase [Aquisphaera giovannonii]QEH34097.1 Dihydropteroate synthase [Aquisphaera giovannonii]
MIEWKARGRAIVGAGDATPRIMGIVNVTPDSFSDGGRVSADAAARHALELVAEGASILDLGGESTRPGSEPVPADEELRRLLPVAESLATSAGVPLSIDTSKAEVARRLLGLGAAIVNDVTALRGDPAMAEVVAEAGAGVVLMHMKGDPRTMQLDPRYDDVVGEVLAFLEGRIEWCVARGIPRANIAVDPGIGFGKAFDHNLDLLRNLGRFASLGCAVVIGTSRKGFLGSITGRDVRGRAVASAVSSLAACEAGAAVARVHDVAAMSDAIKVWTAVRGWSEAR